MPESSRLNVGMLQLCCQADLSQKAITSEHGCELRAQYFDRDQTIVLQVSGGRAAGRANRSYHGSRGIQALYPRARGVASAHA